MTPDRDIWWHQQRRDAGSPRGCSGPRTVAGRSPEDRLPRPRARSSPTVTVPVMVHVKSAGVQVTRTARARSLAPTRCCPLPSARCRQSLETCCSSRLPTLCSFAGTSLPLIVAIRQPQPVSRSSPDSIGPVGRDLAVGGGRLKV